MIYFVAFLVVCLGVLLFLHFRTKRKMSQDLQYMTKKLTAITETDSAERLLLMTDDQGLRDLLNEINSLLDYHQESMADLARLRISTNRMLSNVSHDLKTPLTVISGYIETIQHDKQFSAEERELLLAKVQVKVMEVAGLINTFFDLAKLESEDWQLEMKRIQLNEICRKTILGYYDTLTSKGFAVHIDLPEESMHIEADPAALTRILENLLSNSIRYGKEGKTVGMTLRQDEENVYVDVWDKGKGIQETNKDRIFERLYTADDARTSTAQGSGLGLMIAKRLTEQMQGQIHFTSIPYTKTTFTLTFPKQKLDDYSKLKKVVRIP
ncbi:sensor histidine kinase [Terribacillus saccharophilus]|uniref:sensor histidine kinase n=1 Tax=Terribacillus saccharophilus TaxID=361277 RepID=UPI000BA5840E|nr:sensor histidine kinase [Terribacillus saccharophilus]PAF19115.1 two-component sensor histidine kinase [Terribacillus saccharophilus]